jgi:hypothetical protein
MADQIKEGTRVELLEDKADVYAHAVAGSQGIISDTQVDEGFEMVFVEWDKTHPLFSGEPDGWTFASHFIPVEEDDLEGIEDPETFVEQVLARASQEPDPSADIDGFIKRLSKALTSLAGCEGFLVVTTRREPHPDDESRQFIMPYIYSAALDEQSMISLETQIVQLAAISYQEMALSILASLEDDEDEDGDEEDGRVS